MSDARVAEIRSLGILGQKNNLVWQAKIYMVYRFENVDRIRSKIPNLL